MPILDSTPLDGAGALAALAAGLGGTVHCALMCGPLAGAALPRPESRAATRRWRAIVAWNLGRIGAYALVGTALGSFGGGLAAALRLHVQPVLPWVMAVGFVLAAFDFTRWLPTAPALGGAARWLARRGAALGPAARALALGAATPLLPCGLLWGIFLVAVGAGGPIAGATVLALFALGGTPMFTAVQFGAAWSRRWPRAQRFVRVALPLAAAAVLVWRALGVHAGGGHHPTP